MPQPRRQHPVNIDSAIVVVWPKRFGSDGVVRRFFVERARRAEKLFWARRTQGAGEFAVVLRQRRPAATVRGIVGADKQSASFIDYQIIDDERLDFDWYEQMLHSLFSLVPFVLSCAFCALLCLLW